MPAPPHAPRWPACEKMPALPQVLEFGARAIKSAAGLLHQGLCMRLTPLFLFTGALLLAPVARAQDSEINEQARTHFSAGVNFLQDPDGARYEEAYREFTAAYAASPSWKILGNLGIAAMKLERDGEAIEAFQKYLAGGQATLAPEEKEQFQRDLGTLQAGVVRLN